MVAPRWRRTCRTPGTPGGDVPLHVLPVAALHLLPPGQPDQEAIEAGFDNMPV